MFKRGNLSVRKRFLAGVLAVSMLLGAAGCGKSKDGTSESGGSGSSASTEATVDVKNCTFETDSDISFDKSIGDISNAAKVGDDIALLVLEGTDESEASNGDADYFAGVSKIYLKPISGGQEKLIYESAEAVYVENITNSGDNIAFLETDKSNKKCLKTIDKTGKEISSASLAALDKNKSEYAYISAIRVMDNGDILASMDQTLYILDKDGNEKKTVEFSDYLMGIAITKDGKVIGLSYGSMKAEAIEVNTETGEFGEHYPLSAQYFNSSNAVQTGMGDYDFFYQCEDGLFGYKMATKEDVRICDFNASLIEGNYFLALIMRDEEHFLSLGYDMNTGTQNFEAYKKVDPANVKDKKVLRISGLYASSTLKQNVIDFNKAHTDSRIEIIDYIDDEDPMTKFSTEIAAGNIPDLYDVSQGFGNMSINQAAHKNMFEDLTPYIENDPDISEDDFIESVIDASKIDGKIYYLGSSFGLNTLIAKKSDIGNKDGWNFQEMKQYIDSKPDDVRLFEDNNKETILEYFLYTCMNEFVDWDKNECHFDSQNFKDVLELCNRGTEGETMDYDDMSFISDLQSGKQLFLNGYITPDIWPLYNEIFGKEAACIGYPNEEKKGIYAQINSAIAMSPTCSDKDLAWEFIKFTMSREQQGKNYATNSEGMPTRKDIFEMYLDARATTKDYTDEFGNNITPVTGSYGLGNVVVEMKPITDAERKQFTDLINKIGNVWEYDKSLIDIVTEESKDYFAGDKSIDQVASTIQDRAQTYLNESK
jgi:ABC-type sugar transport system, periplasmic component